MKKKVLSIEVSVEMWEELEVLRKEYEAPSMNKFLKAILEDYLSQLKQSKNQNEVTQLTLVK